MQQEEAPWPSAAAACAAVDAWRASQPSDATAVREAVRSLAAAGRSCALAAAWGLLADLSGGREAAQAAGQAASSMQEACRGCLHCLAAAAAAADGLLWAWAECEAEAAFGGGAVHEAEGEGGLGRAVAGRIARLARRAHHMLQLPPPLPPRLLVAVRSLHGHDGSAQAEAQAVQAEAARAWRAVGGRPVLGSWAGLRAFQVVLAAGSVAGCGSSGCLERQDAALCMAAACGLAAHGQRLLREGSLEEEAEEALEALGAEFGALSQAAEDAGPKQEAGKQEGREQGGEQEEDADGPAEGLQAVLLEAAAGALEASLEAVRAAGGRPCRRAQVRGMLAAHEAEACSSLALVLAYVPHLPQAAARRQAALQRVEEIRRSGAAATDLDLFF